MWEYAKRNDFVIVTFDVDFSDIASMKGSPPKIIWLRTGNMTTNKLVEILIKHQPIINDFVKNKEYEEIDCLEIE
nr:DUF5615 family PIN-like protein [Gillisia sp. Hel_I_86]